MNPIFQMAIIRSIMEHQVKCPRCGYRWLIKNKDKYVDKTCPRCGLPIPGKKKE